MNRAHSSLSSAFGGKRYSAHAHAVIAGNVGDSMHAHCAVLWSDSISEYRLFLANGIVRYLDHRLEKKHERLNTSLAHAAQQLEAAVKNAEQNEQVLLHLQFMARACERMFHFVADVRNYASPAMHVLFSMLERAETSAVSACLPTYARSRTTVVSEIKTIDAYLADHRMEDESFFAVSIPLALSALGSERLPETLGFIYALWESMAALTKTTANGDYFADRSAQLFAAIRTIENDTAVPASVFAGIERGARMFNLCIELLDDATRETASRITKRAAQIMSSKCQFALIHHEHVSLGGRRLVEWFTDASQSGNTLLEVLGQSSWINPEEVDASRFFCSLLSPGGKMHGVFSPSEIDTLKAYFRLGDQRHEPGVTSSNMDDFNRCLSDYRRAVLDAGPTELDAGDFYRHAYFTTINAETHPVGIDVADEVIETVFAEFEKSRLGMEQLNAMKRFEYSAPEFERRVEEIYYYQAKQTKSLDLALDEAGLRKIHAAFAPFALVDGCWLRNISVTHRHSRCGELLFSIFADEIGNGNVEANHANIYSRLLEELGTPLPLAQEEAFAHNADIPHLGFKAPAFLLSLNLRFAQNFPEILGVNLAIEMSGLDGFYEAMIANLEERKMKADFWRVHVSVDNFSTGHARQSVTLIVEHMKEVQLRYGTDAAQLIWERIWRGFLAMIYLFRVELAVLLSTARKRGMSH